MVVDIVLAIALAVALLWLAWRWSASFEAYDELGPLKRQRTLIGTVLIALATLLRWGFRVW